MYLIKTVSDISGVSVRTLHHYDEIGLLSPKKYDNGYRYYTEDDIEILQLILFYKYLGFSLKEIKKLLTVEEVDLLGHLKKQLILINNEKDRLLTLITTLEKTIINKERKLNMSIQEKFEGFTYKDNIKYRDAAIKLYGKEIVENSEAKQKGREEEITQAFNEIFFAFAANLKNGLEATATSNVSLAKDLHMHIRKNAFDCSLSVFSSIGYGYVENTDFKQNIDKFGAGTAQYICSAIQEYVKNN